MQELDPNEIVLMSRLTSENHDLIPPEKKKKNIFMWFINWWLSWAIPGTFDGGALFIYVHTAP